MDSLADGPPYKVRLLYREVVPSPKVTTKNHADLLAALDAVAAGAADAIIGLFHPDIVFYEPANVPSYGGIHYGREAAINALTRIHESFDRLHCEVEEVLAAGDITIVYQQVNFRVRKNGRTGTFPVAELFRFRDGKVIEFRTHYFDSNMIAEALAAE